MIANRGRIAWGIQSLSNLALSRKDDDTEEEAASAMALQLDEPFVKLFIGPREYESVLRMTSATPAAKGAVNGKLKKATLKPKLRTMLKLTAKPFKMLSACLMTMATARPPVTCNTTVAQALAPKWRKGATGP